MAGRMWGWLLICDPPEQTAADIAEALQASRGAISGTARILTDGRVHPPHDPARRPARVLQRRRPRRSTRCSRAPARSTASSGRSRSTASTAADDRPPERARPARRSSTTSMAFIEPRCPALIDRFLARPRGRPTASRATGATSRHRPAKGHRDRHHPDREAHQVLRRAPRDHRRRPRGRARARRSASSARTAPARRRRSGPCSTTSARRAGRALVFGIDTTVDPVAIHRRIGYLPGEFALYDKLTGGQTIDYFANLRGGVDRAYQAAARSTASTSTRAASSRSTRRATSRRSAWSSRSSTGRTC